MATAAVPRTRRRPAAGHALLLLPAAALFALVFAYPLASLVYESFRVDDAASLDNYRKLFEDGTYLQIFWITLQISLWVTVLSLVLGYPIAYLISFSGPRVSGALMLLVLTPFLTSVLVRAFAYVVVLGEQGPVVRAIRELGLGTPTLIYNRFGVIAGMTLTLLPYTVFTLYGTMRRIDRRLFTAAQGLGAGPWTIARTVLLPLSAPGIAGGGLLVFILSLGYFTTPRLLGGSGDLMVGMVIQQSVELGTDFGGASALATILVVATTVGLIAAQRFVPVAPSRERG